MTTLSLSGPEKTNQHKCVLFFMQYLAPFFVKKMLPTYSIVFSENWKYLLYGPLVDTAIYGKNLNQDKQHNKCGY